MGLAGALESAKPRTLETRPAAHMANPDGVPSYPGSLRVSGIHLPTLGQWWGWWQWTGKGHISCMALQAPDVTNSSPNVMALTLNITLSGQVPGNRKLVSI